MATAAEDDKISGEQFRTIREAVWNCDLIGGSAKLVALRLVEHWPRIFPSLATIASKCGLTERTVRTCLRELEAKEVIHTKRRAGTSSTYAFVGVSIPALGRKHRGPPPEEAPPENGSPPPAKSSGEVRQLFPGKPQMEASTKAGRAQPGRSTDPIEARRKRRALPARSFFNLDGWSCSATLRAEGMRATGLSRDAFDARVNALRGLRRIGGRWGVRSEVDGVDGRDAYVRNQFHLWAQWSLQAANGQRGHKNDPSSSSSAGARGVVAPPQRASALNAFPRWVMDSHLDRVRASSPGGGAELLKGLAREWAKQHHIPPSNLDRNVAAQAFDTWLRKRLRAAA